MPGDKVSSGGRDSNPRPLGYEPPKVNSCKPLRNQQRTADAARYARLPYPSYVVHPTAKRFSLLPNCGQSWLICQQAIVLVPKYLWLLKIRPYCWTGTYDKAVWSKYPIELPTKASARRLRFFCLRITTAPEFTLMTSRQRCSQRATEGGADHQTNRSRSPQLPYGCTAPFRVLTRLPTVGLLRQNDSICLEVIT